MKRCKKIITSIFAAVLLLNLIGTHTFAAEEYTYKVTFYEGVQGTFSGNDDLSVTGEEYKITREDGKITVSGLKAGDVVSFNAQNPGAVTLAEDSKYYVKGIRKSGRDNDTVENSAFRVTEDQDYVVAYGMKGNLTTYVVNYVDTNGNTLAPSATYYGNVGDKPVVAYRYIDGYLPQAYGLTKTLSENAEENVFTFTYAIVDSVVVGTPEGTTTRPGNDGADTNRPATNEPTTDTPDVEESQVPQEPDEVIDLDDEETPAGNLDLDNNDMTFVTSIGIGVLAIVAFVLLVLFAKKKRINE